jgi:DNA-directed RNA polymerase subunit RPC12/RpoP
MAVRIRCACNKILVLKGERLPKSVRCPNCGKVRDVPVPARGPKLHRTALEKSIQGPAAKQIRLKCTQCGATYSRPAWRPGEKCRVCKSTKIAPLIEDKRLRPPGLELVPAGLTRSDLRFGRLAVWTNCVRREDLEKAQAVQQRASRRGGGVPFVGVVLKKAGVLTDRDYTVLVKLLDRPVRGNDERLFCETARGLRSITGEQLRECQRIQAAQRAQGQRNVAIEDLLIEKDYIKERRAAEVFEQMRKGGKGVLADFDRLRGRPDEGWVERLRAASVYGWRQNPLVAAAAMLVAGVCLAASLGSIFGEAHYEAPEVRMLCRECDHVARIVDRGAPVACPTCEAKALYYVKECPRCGREVTFDPDMLRAGLRCPKCRYRFRR